MERKGNKVSHSVIAEYEIGENYFMIQFLSGRIYKYNALTASADLIEKMKSLVILGRQLDRLVHKDFLL